MCQIFYNSYFPLFWNFIFFYSELRYGWKITNQYKIKGLVGIDNIVTSKAILYVESFIILILYEELSILGIPGYTYDID